MFGRVLWLVACLVVVTLAASLERRALPFTTPSHYHYDWSNVGHRCSYGTSAYISRSTIPNHAHITQTVVDKCAALCTKNTKCGFFHPIQMQGGTEGGVICALFTTRQAESSCTNTKGTPASGGIVDKSYGYYRTTATAVAAHATTTSSRRSSTTTRRSTATSRKTTTTSRKTTTTSRKSTSTTSSTRRSTSTTTKRSTTTTKPATSTLKTTTSAKPTTTTKAATTTTRAATTTTRAATTTTTTTTTTTSTGPSLYPASPTGARLIKYKGCKSTDYTIPMFVNKNYPVGANAVSTAETVWLVQHGSKRDFDDSFNALYRIVGDEGVIISPNFYAVGDPVAPATWYDNTTLAWDSNDWFNGDDAIGPADTGACSSFDIIDTLIASLRNTNKYPNLKRIISVAHSGGSSMMGRYGMLSGNTDIIYVLANAPAMPYFTTARPIPPQDCKYFMAWGYGFTYSLPRYVAANNPGPLQAFKNWAKMDVTLMTGDYDTYSRDSTGDQSCYAVCEGGMNRRDRGYAYWAYLNLYAGTDTDVSQFYGYNALKQQVDPITPAPRFNIRHCVVDMVAHYNYGMYSSACGRAAIYNNATLPPGPGPLRPA